MPLYSAARWSAARVRCVAVDHVLKFWGWSNCYGARPPSVTARALSRVRTSADLSIWSAMKRAAPAGTVLASEQQLPDWWPEAVRYLVQQSEASTRCDSRPICALSLHARASRRAWRSADRVDNKFFVPTADSWYIALGQNSLLFVRVVMSRAVMNRPARAGPRRQGEGRARRGQSAERSRDARGVPWSPASSFSP
jgi:hypothetical protein